MSASLAISSAALAQSSAANSRARIAECKAFMPTYDPTTASVADMQSYASCIERLYPTAMSSNEILLLKTAIVLALIGLVIGIYKGVSEGYYLEDKCMYSLGYGVIFAAVGPFLLGLIAAVIAGATWVLS